MSDNFNSPGIIAFYAFCGPVTIRSIALSTLQATDRLQDKKLHAKQTKQSNNINQTRCTWIDL